MLTSMSGISPEQHAILLVDDSETDVLLIKRALAKAGLEYPVQSVPGGIEALAYLNGDPPFDDRSRYPTPLLVLLDATMHGMDGWEVLSCIKKVPALSALPVVILTGLNDAANAKRAHDLGATAFVQKSPDFGASPGLLSMVRGLIAQRML